MAFLKKFIKNISKDDKKFIILALISLSIPLTLILSQQQQTFQNHAQSERQIALGVSYNSGQFSKNGEEAGMERDIQNYHNATGRYPSFFSIWVSIGTGLVPRNSFPSKEILDYLAVRKITPMIFLASDGSAEHKGPNGDITEAQKFGNKAIAKGSFDNWFREFAQDAKSYRTPDGKTLPIVVRYDQEMNGTWFPWSPYYPAPAGQPCSGRNGCEYYDTGNRLVNGRSQDFIDAWQHIYGLMKKNSLSAGGVEAKNLYFFWCPYPGYQNMQYYYPGDSFVDFVGFDPYLMAGMKYQSMATLFKQGMSGIHQTAPGKPIIIGEMGIASSFGTQRPDWILDGYAGVFNSYDKIVGISYFNMGPWAFSSNIYNSLASVLTDTRFQGSLFNPALPTPTPKPTVKPTPTAKPTAKPTPTITPKPTIVPADFSSITIYPKADSYTSSSFPNTNYGGSTELHTDINNPYERIYFKFDLSNLANKTIDSAYLYITMSNETGSATSATQTMVITDKSWEEATLTYNNTPQRKSVYKRISPSELGDKIDVTSLVRSYKGDVVPFLIENDTSINNKLIIKSKEASSGRPYLYIRYR